MFPGGSFKRDLLFFFCGNMQLKIIIEYENKYRHMYTFISVGTVTYFWTVISSDRSRNTLSNIEGKQSNVWLGKKTKTCN